MKRNPIEVFAFAMVCVCALHAQAANIVRYGTNAAAFNPSDAGTYTQISDATWAQLNDAISNAMNTVTKGFVYVSGDVYGTGSTNGSLRITWPSGTNGFEMKGGYNSGFTSRDVLKKSLLDVRANSSSKSRALVISSTNVLVDGFKITGGYHGGSHDVYGSQTHLVFADTGAGGAGVAMNVVGKGYVRLQNLDIMGNTLYGDWKHGGGVYIEMAMASVTIASSSISSNTIRAVGSAGVYSGGLEVDDTSSGDEETKFTMALCRVVGNMARGSGGTDDAIGLKGPSRVTNTNIWTLFGSVIAGNYASDSSSYSSVSLWGPGSYSGKDGRDMLMNCTVIDNTKIGTYGDPVFACYKYGNYLVNTVLADNDKEGSPEFGNSGGQWNLYYFENCLLDSDSPCGSSATNGFFGTFSPNCTITDSGGCLQVADALFENQAGGDYRLKASATGYMKGLAKYSPGGLGFAYVDVNRNGAYNAGTDIIVNIKPGSGQYVPGSNEFYYPTDLNGSPWISISRYNSTADLVGKMTMGAVARRIGGGTVIVLR